MDDRFEIHFQELWRVAYKVSHRLCCSSADAEDIAADTLADALRSWRQIREPIGWVSRVAARKAVRHVRRTPAPRVAQDLVSTESPYAEGFDLTLLIGRLPRRQREVVALRYAADLSEQEVAATLGISIGSVKTHASRGLAALRRGARVAIPEADLDNPPPPGHLPTDRNRRISRVRRPQP